MPGLDQIKDPIEEANRQLVICNACRYCEGYCPVFQAIETRRDFKSGDVFYLAHLCHDCRACYYACMYTPPHEFAINIPRLLAETRIATYRRWSWPGPLARAFTNANIGATLAALIAATIVIATAIFVTPSRLFAPHTGPGAFYQIIPYLAMVIPALALFFYGIAVWLHGAVQFWSETGDKSQQGNPLRALVGAAGNALSLSYLKGGGPGCYYPGQLPSGVRRTYHGLVFWGFLSALLSTTLAFIDEDFLHWMPPYPLASAPVIFGSLGGIALIVGTAGLLWFKPKSDPDPTGAGAKGLDYTFLFLLGVTSLTGMATLAFRATAGLGTLLTLHLATIAALFASAPYGKFVHFVYRSLAVLRFRMEQQATVQKSAKH